METMIIKPKNKEQLVAVTAALKVLKVDFIVEKAGYNPEFLSKPERAEHQIKSGKYKVANFSGRDAL
jgi:hypothetical protein